jgi:nucleoid DNA-binding protein
MASRNSKLFRLALQIHDLLDIPLNKHNDPDVGFKIIRAISTTMRDALKRGESVSVRGFGKFRVVEPKGIRRTGNNIARQSGERYAAPLQHMPKRYVKFIPSEQLKAMLNSGTTWDEKRAMEIWDK